MEMGADGRIDALLYRRANAIHRVRGRIVVLALGAVETPRLLLATRSARMPDGIANSSGLLARYFMETMYVALTVRFDERIDAYKGPPIDSRIWDFSRPARDAGVRAGFALGVSGTFGGFHGPMSYALQIPGIGRAHNVPTSRRSAGWLCSRHGSWRVTTIMSSSPCRTTSTHCGWPTSR